MGPESEEGQETVVLWDITLENYHVLCCILQDVPKGNILLLSHFSFSSLQQENTPAELAGYLQHVSRVIPGSVLEWTHPHVSSKLQSLGNNGYHSLSTSPMPCIGLESQ